MRRFRVRIKDGEMAGIAFGDPTRPFEIVFLHATGFNGITYHSLLEPLGPQAHLAALDLRGHGRTTLPANPRRLRSWSRYRDDVIQVLEQNAPHGAILGGHSMGATVALAVAGKRPELVRGLVLADPVLRGRRSPWAMLTQRNAGGKALAKGALRRRNAFVSPSEAVELLQGRGAFRTWRTPFLEDYAIDGVLRQEDGGYALACAPAWEAATFRCYGLDPWGAVRRLRRKRIPIILLQAEKESTAGPDTDQRIHAVRPDAAVTRVPGTTHFLPMERPYVVRDALRLLFEATLETGAPMDYVGAVRRTINEGIGVMN